MWLSDLQEHDYQHLESYWFRFKEIVDKKYESENQQRNSKNIIEAIEKLYNESDGIMRELIEQGYFNSNDKKLDPYIHEQLGITINKLSYMRKGLMQETAELIAYVV